MLCPKQGLRSAQPTTSGWQSPSMGKSQLLRAGEDWKLESLAYLELKTWDVFSPPSSPRPLAETIKRLLAGFSSDFILALVNSSWVRIKSDLPYYLKRIDIGKMPVSPGETFETVFL